MKNSEWAKIRKAANSFFAACAEVQAHHERLDRDPAYKARCEAEQARDAAARAKQIADDAKRNNDADAEFDALLDDPEFREIVIAEIVAAGAIRIIAENRTSSRAKLFNEAQKFDLI